MAIISGLQTAFGKIKPEEIVSALRSDYSQQTDFIADMISFDKSKGDANTTPREPSTIGVRGLIDASSYWQNRANLNNGRSYTAGAVQTSDQMIIFGGSNDGSTANVIITERHVNSTNIWSLRNPASEDFARRSHLGFALTSDLAISAGGVNSSNNPTARRYSDSGNTWSSRTSTNSGDNSVEGACFTSDLGFKMPGNSNNTPELYSDSGNSWTNKTTQAVWRWQGAGASMTSDSCLQIGGANAGTIIGAYTDQYTIATNAWISKNSLGTSTNYSGVLNAMSQTSDTCVVAGTNGASTISCAKFSNSANAWYFKTNMSVVRHGVPNIAFTANVGMAIGGYTALASTERFTDNSVILTSGFDMISNRINDTPAVPNTSATQQVITKKLFSVVPSKIIAAAVVNKNSTTPDVTVDVSVDGGVTWLITGKAANTAIDCSSLSGSDVRLRFNLGRDAVANVWTSRTNTNSTHTYFAGAASTSDRGFCLSGSNLPVEIYSDSGNTWTNRGGAVVNYGHTQVSLTSDLAMIIGYVYNTNYNVRYSYSGSTTISRANNGLGRVYGAGSTLTSDLGLSFGGRNATSTDCGYTEKYTDSSNAFSALNAYTWYTESAGGIGLNTDLSLKFGGSSYIYTQYYYTSIVAERNTLSGNAWSMRTFTPTGKCYTSANNVSSDIVIAMGSYGSGGISKITHKYSDSGNMWWCSANLNTCCFCGGGFNLADGNSMYFAGWDISSVNTQSAEKYTNGESNFKGFGLRFI